MDGTEWNWNEEGGTEVEAEEGAMERVGTAGSGRLNGANGGIGGGMARGWEVIRRVDVDCERHRMRMEWKPAETVERRRGDTRWVPVGKGTKRRQGRMVAAPATAVEWRRRASDMA